MVPPMFQPAGGTFRRADRLASLKCSRARRNWRSSHLVAASWRAGQRFDSPCVPFIPSTPHLFTSLIHTVDLYEHVASMIEASGLTPLVYPTSLLLYSPPYPALPCSLHPSKQRHPTKGLECAASGASWLSSGVLDAPPRLERAGTEEFLDAPRLGSSGP